MGAGAMRTHGLGRLFWHTVRLTGAPIVHRGKTSMLDWPYRYARPVIIRPPGCSQGIAIGWWRDHRELDIGRHLAESMVLGDLPDPERVGFSHDYGDRLITSDSAAERGEDGQRLEVTVTIL